MLINCYLLSSMLKYFTVIIMILTRELVDSFISHSLAYLFDELCFGRCKYENLDNLKELYENIFCDYQEQLSFDQYIETLDLLRPMLLLDLKAAYDGDPSATSNKEIILTFPGFYAIMVHRIAHQIALHNIPLIPRMMSELAHNKTGIDIHPDAKIGKSFFIDHGTGVVIGQTCEIGDNVRIYQGVTLGAISLKDVESKRGIKRHPTIKNNVIIYSNASILGGNTVIGNNVIIGSNVFLTSSVPDNKKVLLSSKNYQILDVI